MTKTTRLIHTATRQPLMGPEAEAMLREAADGQPARPRHGDTQDQAMTRSWLHRNGWIDDRGELTPKAEQTLEAGSWPPADALKPHAPRQAPEGFGQ